jgi:5-(carboxyamino)imidazole ribonucleotide mutase
MKKFVKIIMGSEKDFEYCKNIGNTLDRFEITYEYHVGSAHKTPEIVLEILNEDEKDLNLVYITVAGRSNALSAFVDYNTTRPVIACPPYSDKYGGADIFSSLRTPSGSGVITVLEPETAGIAAVKILGVNDKELIEKIEHHQKNLKEKISKADKEVKKYGKC